MDVVAEHSKCRLHIDGSKYCGDGKMIRGCSALSLRSIDSSLSHLPMRRARDPIDPRTTGVGRFEAGECARRRIGVRTRRLDIRILKRDQIRLRWVAIKQRFVWT